MVILLPGRHWSIRLCGISIGQSENGTRSVGPPRQSSYKYAPNGNFDIINRSASLLTGRAERRLNLFIKLYLR